MGDVVPFPTIPTCDNDRRCDMCVHGSEDGTYCWLVREHLLFDIAPECETYERDSGRG